MQTRIFPTYPSASISVMDKCKSRYCVHRSKFQINVKMPRKKNTVVIREPPALRYFGQHVPRLLIPARIFKSKSKRGQTRSDNCNRAVNGNQRRDKTLSLACRFCILARRCVPVEIGIEMDTFKALKGKSIKDRCSCDDSRGTAVLPCGSLDFGFCSQKWHALERLD